MTRHLFNIAAVLTFLSAWQASAADLVARHADLVEPEAALRQVVSELQALVASGRKANIRKVERFFAPRVKVFQRSLDPFQPWNPADDIRGDYLNGVADVMVERGELQEGAPVPDYRTDAMKQMAGVIGDTPTFGRKDEVQGATCVPATYDVDRKAALAFSGRFELDAYSLSFFERPMTLHERPSDKAPVMADIPAGTLLMFDYDKTAPEDWSLYETSGGTKGYIHRTVETLGLAQNHICFGKVKGRYRITAIFGYGL